MSARFWEAIATVTFLIVCLIAGLVLGELYAPKPVIGVVRFEGVIDSTSAQQMGAIL
ncbi:MAG: hypothetical protein GTN71_07005, partial [Anaerolineae bacterium]|nr:hypothetical protein [Anaerolineae bacterium]